jgi:hypothetical protein
MPTGRRQKSDAVVEPQWVQWRMERLLRLGVSAELADRLSHDGQLDIHALLELVDRGCPPHTAARILAPLDPAASLDPEASLDSEASPP